MDLPDPRWAPPLTTCPGCGYALAGLAPGDRCPECGLPMSPRVFEFHGVPTIKSVLPGWSIALIILGVVGLWLAGPAMIIGVFLMLWRVARMLGEGVAPFVLVGVLFLGGIAGIVYAILRFRSRTIGGTSLMILGNGRLTVIPIGKDDRERQQFGHGLDGSEQVELISLSRFWAKLRIRRAGQVVFQAGIRCSKDDLPGLRAAFTEQFGPAGPTP